MINGAALTDLCTFLSNPQTQHLTKILSIPGLYRVLKSRPTINSFLPLLLWLANRAYVVLQQLSVEPVPLPYGLETAIAQSDWKVVSVLKYVASLRADIATRRGASTAFPKFESVLSIPS